MLALALDGSILVLLLLVLGLGLRIHLGLARMRHDEGALRGLIDALDTAIGRAEAALGELKGIADQTAERLADDRERTRRLLDDLQFLSDRGTQLADRLAADIRRGRDGPGPGAVGGVRGARSRPVTARPEAATGPAGDLERTLSTLR